MRRDITLYAAGAQRRHRLVLLSTRTKSSRSANSTIRRKTKPQSVEELQEFDTPCQHHSTQITLLGCSYANLDVRYSPVISLISVVRVNEALEVVIVFPSAFTSFLGKFNFRKTSTHAHLAPIISGGYNAGKV